MLLTNILLGIIIFFMIIIFGGICNIDRNMMSEVRKRKLADKGLHDLIRKVKDEKKIKNEN